MTKWRLFLRRHIFPFWKTFIVILTPLLLLPLPLLVHGAVRILNTRSDHQITIIKKITLLNRRPEPVTVFY